jgi:hypothetical protein
VDFGTKTMGLFSQHMQAEHALTEVRLSLLVLGKGDLDKAKQESLLDLQKAIINLGALSKNDLQVLCTGQDRQALSDAGDYGQAHPDPILSPSSPYWSKGIKFCDSQHRDPSVSVSYMTAGKD